MVNNKCNKTSFKKGHIHTEEIKKKIRRSLKKYYKTHIFKKKIITEKERKRLAILSLGRKCSEKQKKYMSRIMKGKATKWLRGKPSNSKGHHLSEEHKNKLRTTIQKHHIDLNKQNNKKRNILYLPPKIHQYLHKWAYRYLVEIGQIKLYTKWFENRLNIKLIKTRGWD